MRLRAGSFTWLVQHELLLRWRRFNGHFSGRSSARVLGISALGMIFMHVISGPTANLFKPLDGPAQTRVLATAVLFTLSWQVSQAISHFARLLYSRSDLDLLLSSPISPRAVVGAHAFVAALEIIIVVGVFLFPMANMIAYKMGLHWLAIYPASIASALFASACGLAITAGLFRLFGPYRARMAAQITSTVIASAMILGGQLAYLATGPTQATRALLHKLPSAPAFTEWLISAPVRGVAGDMVSLSLWLCFGAVAFAAAVLWLGPGFLEGAILVKGAGDRQLVVRAKSERPFRPGAGAALRRKEVKLLLRDPWLFSRALLQLFYLAPICFVIWISRTDPSLSLLVAPVLIMVLSHLAGIMAWLTILNEDAVDFMATAPVTQDAIMRNKLYAIALLLGFILLAPALALGWSEPFDAVLMVIFAIAACVSTALVNIWHPAPGKLEAATSRHNPPKMVALKENMLSVFWAVACASAISQDSAWSRYALAALVFLWFNRPRRKASG